VGSGFFVEDGSRVVTNAHVVNGQHDLITVNSHDGNTYKARIEKLDDINDLAVLRLEDGAHNKASLKVGTSAGLATGADLYVVGHPEGRNDTYISPGLFQRRYPLNEIGKGMNIPDAPKSNEFSEMLKHAAGLYGAASQRDYDAYVSSERLDMFAHGRPGNSGSAVVDGKGEVIGVLANGGTVDQLKEFSWSVPSEKLQALLDPNNKKFDFQYEQVSAWHSMPIVTSVFTGGISALTLGLPRVGGTVIGGISLLTVPSEFEAFTQAKDSNARWYSGLNLASDAGFIAGAVLAYFPRARLASRLATLTGIGGMIGAEMVPHYEYLTDIKRTTGDTRPPFLWE
jgi:hypothetical protein